MPVRAHPRSTGDGFLAALERGALASAGLDEFYGRNLPAPPAEFSPERFVEVSQLYGRHAVAINARGERYADEGADWSETALTRATAHQPGLYAWYVLDAAGLEARVRERTVRDMVETARSVGGTVVEASSLGGLADELGERGVPRDTVFRTLEEYNAAVATGRETTPPRTGPARALRLPPFVAVKVAPYITHTVGGLTVDARLQGIAGGGCEADPRPLRRRGRGRRCLCWRVHERPRLGPRLRQDRRGVGGRRREGVEQDIDATLSSSGGGPLARSQRESHEQATIRITHTGDALAPVAGVSYQCNLSGLGDFPARP